MDRFRNFMNGRYGRDSLNTCLVVLAAVLLVLGWLFGRLFRTLSALALLIAFYRMFSKDLYARRLENERFRSLFARFEPYVKLLRAKAKDKGKNKLLLCPNCKRILRVPKGKGNITLHCPCGLFIKAKS